MTLPAHLAPDTALAGRFLATRPIPGRLLLCGVTGAHHYGFPSPDSDLDLKGIHLAPTEALLGLSVPAETWDETEWFEGVECDLTSHELGKAMHLLLRGNGNMLERILSPYQVVRTDELAELQALARASVGKQVYGHYRGYFAGMQREHAREPRTKSMLYTYRVALTGIHLLTTGELEADVSVNGPRYGVPEVVELVALKAAAKEKASLPADLDARFRAGWERLAVALDTAHAESALPEAARNAAEIERWVVARRKRSLGA